MRTGIIQSTLCRAYRFFRHHGGYGVHSPYAYHLITQVIGERRGYYAYDDIELVRKQLAQQGEWHRDLTAKEGKLLFRLANFAGARKVVQLGSNDGLAALYLTYHSREARCVVVEPEPERARNASKVYERWGRGAIELREGDYIKQIRSIYSSSTRPTQQATSWWRPRSPCLVFTIKRCSLSSTCETT